MFCKDKKLSNIVSFLKQWKSQSKSKKSSFVTIMALWSSMLGSTSLVLPWAVTKTGLEISLISLLLFMAMCGYTAYLIVWLQKKMPDAQTTKPDFNVICHKYLNSVGSNVSFILSMISLILPGIVLYILTVNNSFYVVDFTSELSTNQFEMLPITTNVIICDKNFNFISNLSLGSNKTTSEDLYPLIWNTHLTVPLFCLLIFFPILAIKTPAFFIKLNAFGILPIIYLLFFITFKSAIWGFNSDYFSNFFSFRHFNTSFSTLGGILFLAFLMHNSFIPILENQKNLCNNARDLSISFVLGTVTLGYIGPIYTFFFPSPKDCITDNLLNNFPSTDILAFIVPPYWKYRQVLFGISLWSGLYYNFTSACEDISHEIDGWVEGWYHNHIHLIPLVAIRTFVAQFFARWDVLQTVLTCFQNNFLNFFQ